MGRDQKEMKDHPVGEMSAFPRRRKDSAERGISLVEVPKEEFESMGGNVLAVAPRVCLAVEGNPVTKRRLEEAGAEVHLYKGEEISVPGSGGPTCLTRPLLRGA